MKQRVLNQKPKRWAFWGFLDRGRQMSVGSRRFPAPWDIEEYDRSCFIVRDNNGQALAYVYFETEPGRHAGGKIQGVLQFEHAGRVEVEFDIIGMGVPPPGGRGD
jgi:hypothetical protein